MRRSPDPVPLVESRGRAGGDANITDFLALQEPSSGRDGIERQNARGSRGISPCAGRIEQHRTEARVRGSLNEREQRHR